MQGIPKRLTEHNKKCTVASSDGEDEIGGESISQRQDNQPKPSKSGTAKTKRTNKSVASRQGKQGKQCLPLLEDK
uniref:Uncharacterized protein n=1 Tax=Timema bartmani TaxID=61472 RepID=A0A7R9FCP7_9NEOP|nr:unnamed protein product [Timema bartmani]